jgi:type IV pilus assembly protein PilC
VELKVNISAQKKKLGSKDKSNSSVWEVMSKAGDIDLSFGAFSDAVKESFFHDLYVLLDSGMDLRTSLEIVGSEHKKLKIQNIIKTVEKDVIEGMKLSDSLKKHSEFDEYECVNVRIGEETGNLKEVFWELSKYFNSKITLKKQILSIVSYPAFILTVTIGIVWFMLSVVVPMFTDVFSKLNGELPELTKTVVGISDFIRNYFGYVILGVLVIIGLFWTQKKKIWYQQMSAWFVLKIPIIGELVRKVHLNRFSLAMKMMLYSETPVLNSINLMRDMTSFYPLSIALQDVRDNLFNGKHLHEGLAQHEFFPKRYVTLVKVGEEVNQLAQMFEKLSTQLNDEIEYQTQILGRILEPVMIIFIGVFVGFILISMYLPLFELSTTIN